jgi:hypothetical protein
MGVPFKVYPHIWSPEASATPKPIVNTQPDALRVEEKQEKPGGDPHETDSTKVKAQSTVAANTLAQKNRKKKSGPKMELPFDPTMEEGTMWNLTGFAPSFDGKWLVHEVVFTFTGKGGSRMEIDLMAPPDKITASSTAPTTAQKRALIKNESVGAEPNPTPVNIQSGMNWLPTGKAESAPAGGGGTAKV